ncbi:MAG: hypothetical protein VKS61_17925 [Candidatus Sericytochromatia bacterium]|nr:hypothetical protein [Candidatus Sericytochromatia bacterium]
MLLFLGWLLLGGVGLACYFLYRLTTAAGARPDASPLETGGANAHPLAGLHWVPEAYDPPGEAWEGADPEECEDDAPAWAEDGAAWDEADGWGHDDGGFDAGGYDGGFDAGGFDG